jgi:hypothetical protein
MTLRFVCVAASQDLAMAKSFSLPRKIRSLGFGHLLTFLPRHIRKAEPYQKPSTAFRW